LVALRSLADSAAFRQMARRGAGGEIGTLFRAVFALALLAPVTTVASAIDAKVERMLKQLDPDARFEQICDLEAMQRIGKDKTYRPERTIVSALADPKVADTTMTGAGGAFKSKGQWYQFYHNIAISGQGNLRSICVDRLEFNKDGTIREVIQTKAGPAALPSGSHSSQSTVHYDITSATLGNGATIDEDGNASERRAVHNLHLPDSFVEFTRVDGGETRVHRQLLDI
jgi:hypothetical protein